MKNPKNIKNPEVEQRVNAHMLAGLFPVSSVLAAVYLIFTLGHIFYLPEDAAKTMVPLAAISTVIFFAVALTARQKIISANRANGAGVLIAATALLNSIAQLYVTADPLQSTNLMLVMLGTSLLLTERHWVAWVFIGAWAGWLFNVYAAPESPQWLHFGFAMMATSALSIIVFVVRIHSLTMLEESRLQEQKNSEELAESLNETELLNIELLHARDQAEKANKSKTQFLANISHELRTPINGMLGLTDEVLQTQLDNKQKELLQTAHASAQALAHMFQDIITLSSLEDYEMDVHPAKTDLAQLCSDVHDLYITSLAPGVKFSVEIDPDLPSTLMLEEVRLRQILVNLAGNAVKFTTEGKISLVVKKQSQQGGRLVLGFEINDTGPGISEGHQESIFRAFHQEDASLTRDQGGIGLGLTIAARLTQQLGYELELRSIQGEGSCFSFCANAEICDAGASTGPAPETVAIQRNIPRHVLVAEDNRVNQKVICAFLDRLNCTVELAENGVEALSAALRDRFDLILMDIQMPEMDGLEATRQILKQVQSPPPIVALTAHAMDHDRAASHNAGMAEHLSKPVNIEQLRQTIERLT